MREAPAPALLDVTDRFRELSELCRLARSLRGVLPSGVRHRLSILSRHYLEELANGTDRTEAAAGKLRTALWEGSEEAASVIVERWKSEIAAGRPPNGLAPSPGLPPGTSPAELLAQAATWVSTSAEGLPALARVLAAATD